MCIKAVFRPNFLMECKAALITWGGGKTPSRIFFFQANGCTEEDRKYPWTLNGFPCVEPYRDCEMLTNYREFCACQAALLALFGTRIRQEKSLMSEGPRGCPFAKNTRRWDILGTSRHISSKVIVFSAMCLACISKWSLHLLTCTVLRAKKIWEDRILMGCFSLTILRVCACASYLFSVGLGWLSLLEG